MFSERKLTREQYLKVAPVLRFLRTIIPQIPAVVVYLLDVAKTINAPYWVAPVLVFVGALATAVDKLIRELKKENE